MLIKMFLNVFVKRLFKLIGSKIEKIPYLFFINSILKGCLQKTDFVCVCVCVCGLKFTVKPIYFKQFFYNCLLYL